MEASSSLMPQFDIPVDWERSAADIIRHRWRKVLIIGNVDSGKSTYGAFLSHRFLAAGFGVAIVDADIGQKDIGPPATITLGYPESTGPLADLKPAAVYFVGAVSPVGRLLPMVVGTRRLVDAAQAAFVLINTTGFVHGAGRILKSYKIEALQPDIILALERGTELQPILSAYRNYRVRRIRPSVRAITKTPQYRTAARKRAFSRYFQTATEVILPCEKLIFQRGPVLTTVERHLLCGVTDKYNKGLGLAIVMHIDALGGNIELFTPVPAEHIGVIQGGDLYLSPDGRELGRR